MRLQNIKIWQHLIFSFPYEARKSSVKIFITCFQWNGISLDILSGNLNHLKLTLTSNWQRSQVGIMPLEIRSGKYLQVFVFYPASCLQNVTRKDALFLSCWIKKTEKKKKEESATGKKTEKVVNNQKLNLKKTKWKGMTGKKRKISCFSPVSGKGWRLLFFTSCEIRKIFSSLPQRHSLTTSHLFWSFIAFHGQLIWLHISCPYLFNFTNHTASVSLSLTKPFFLILLGSSIDPF